MTPPNAPTAAEVGEEALFARILDLRHWTSDGNRKRHDCKCEDCRAIKQIVHLARQAVATSQSKRAKQLAEMESALLAARRERETAYETTAQVRDALSEEILKLRDHLAAARRENETMTEIVRRVAAWDDAYQMGISTTSVADIIADARAALTAAHGEDR